MKSETELTGVEKALTVKLREIWDDDDFVLGVRVCLQTDEERQEVLQAVHDGKIADSDEITLYALDIHTDREEMTPCEKSDKVA